MPQKYEKRKTNDWFFIENIACSSLSFYTAMGHLLSSPCQLADHAFSACWQGLLSTLARRGQ